MIKIPSFDEIRFIIRSGWYDLLNTDFDQLKYAATDFAVKIGAIVALIVLLKLVWVLLCKVFGWHKYSRVDSGHTASRDSGRGLLAGFLLTLPKVALLVPLAVVAVALADPLFTVIKEERTYTTSRTIVRLRDVSASMQVQFKQSEKTKGEIAMESDLKFLELRRGKNDRSAFWLFSDDPYPIQEDFLADDEIAYLKAYDAPWVLGGSVYNRNKIGPGMGTQVLLPPDRYLQVSGQGGTQLSETLKVIIQLFDEDEEKQKNNPHFRNAGRALVIITDTAISDLSRTKLDFEELSKRKIVPYVIYVNESSGTWEPNRPGAYIPELIKEVIARGGKFFPVSDEKAIENAVREIDKLEMVEIEIKNKVFNVHVFYKFVFLAILCLFVIIPIGLLTELLSSP